MPWTDLLAADRIVLLVDAVTREQVLDAAARLLGDRSPLNTPLIAAALREREALGSTGIGRGVALPHARGPMFHQPRGAFLRLSRPVGYAANDGAPVDLVFAICAPEDMPDRHLQHLAGIAERFADPAYLAALRAAPSLAMLRQLLLAPPEPPVSTA